MQPASPTTSRGLAALHWVRLELGKSPSEIRDMADGGDLMGGRLVWVWDIARASGSESRRELRFWPLEVKSFGLPVLKEIQSMLAPNVIRQVIGSDKQTFRTDEIVALLSSDTKSVWHLWQDGQIAGAMTGHSLRITRDSLEQFLDRRLIGARNAK